MIQNRVTAVIARSDSDEAIQNGTAELDCFASLAMTMDFAIKPWRICRD
jgi:hypothetical protein